MDNLTKEQRGRNMALIKSRDNASTEKAFLVLLKKNGIKGWRRHNTKMPGKPDFIFSQDRAAVFIDGCFWHKCPKCFVRPATEENYWITKIDNNVRRDKLVNKKLKSMNWTILRFWEHSVKKSPSQVIHCLEKNLIYTRKNSCFNSEIA